MCVYVCVYLLHLTSLWSIVSGKSDGSRSSGRGFGFVSCHWLRMSSGQMLRPNGAGAGVGGKGRQITWHGGKCEGNRVGKIPLRPKKLSIGLGWDFKDRQTNRG